MINENIIDGINLQFLMNAINYEDKKLPLYLDDNGEFHLMNKALKANCLPNFYRNYNEKQTHCHEYYEIEICFKGHGIHFMNGEKIVINPGTVLFIKPGEYHSYKNTSEYLDMFTLMFNESFIYGNEEWKYPFKMAMNNQSYYISIDDDSFKQIQMMCALSSHKFYFSEDLVEFTQFFKMTLDMVFKQYSVITYSDIENEFLRKIELYVRNNLSKKITLKMLSENIYMEEKYISAKFSKLKKMKIIDYINNLKIDAAKGLLMTTDLNVMDIAMECGMNNISYFYRLFKKSTGVSPIEFRNKYTIYK